MQHRFAAGDREGVYAAIPCLIKEPEERLKSPLRHQRGIVCGVETVPAVIIALPGDHQIHLWKIPVVIPAGQGPFIRQIPFPTRYDESLFFQSFQTIAPRKIMRPVTKTEQLIVIF